jgi:hypothetical protein
MPASLFTNPAGGSFADNLARAREFASSARTGGAPPAAAQAEVAAALAGDIGVPAASQVATEVAAPVAAQQAPDLEAAARAAAQASIADSAYAASAAQQLDVVVQPRLIVQGQMGPTVIPVDVAVPAAFTNVSIAPATARVIDPATGQAIAAQVVAPAAESVAASPVRSLRSMGAQDIGALFGGGGARRASVATSATAGEAVAAAASNPGWRDQINHAIEAARGPARGAAGPAPATAAANVADEVAEAVVKTAGASGRAGLFTQLREAAAFAAKLR